MITVRDLTFTYPKADREAVAGLTFEVGSGELFGFLGPSGAGKSTTQKILIALLRDYRGEVSVLGRDLEKWASDYYERIGVSFEFPNHFLKLTARENLTYFGRLYQGACATPRELLSEVGLEDAADLPVSQFSKGMKNRLSVVRALLHSPELLFLDEPTAGLDPVSARRIKNLIRKQKEAGKTIFLTTHDMTVADELCDRVAFIVDGRITAIDRPRELKLRHGQATVRVEFAGANGTQSRDFALAGLGENREFMDLLRRGSLQTLHSQEATLEEVFIQVTGRGLQ